MTVTHATDALTEAFEIAVEELGGFLARVLADRTLIVERENSKFWIAHFPDRDDPLYRSPDMHATWRFAQTFAERTPGVTASFPEWETYSMRVPDEPVPDNVVPILGRVEA